MYMDDFLRNKRIYLPWEGYKVNLKQYPSRENMRDLVRQEKGEIARTSISNWSGQLFSFCWEMKKDDYVLIPQRDSRAYTLAKISGDYTFSDLNANGLCHSREIKVLMMNIPRAIFSQAMKYTLGAYRTVFKIKDEKELLTSITRFRNQKRTIV